MALEYPLINGVRFTWSSIKVNVGAVQYLGCKSVNINEKGDAAKMHGTTQTILGAGAPMYDADGDMEFYQQEGDVLLQAVAALPGKPGWMNKPLTVTVQYIDEGQPLTTVKMLVRLAGRTVGGSEGTELLTTKFPLFFLAPVETTVDGNRVIAVPPPPSSAIV